ncbi:MAG TPA: peptidyl-prolyl cis-trans isomerase [Thermoanaerobaculia bacterium]|nr:peptidyl-prolyl cis-trans isomerase [Thermoanaerobaculia bacterium]
MSLRPLALALLLLAACSKNESALPPDVVAQVGTRNITMEDFKRYLERNAGTELAQLVPEAASALLDQHVQEVLLSEFATKRGVEVSADEVAAAVREQPGSTAAEKRDQLRRDALLTELAGELTPPSPDVVRAYYHQYIREFRFDERVRVRQILVQDEEKAAEVVKKLRAGTDFSALSTEYSRAPNAPAGGEIGWITRSELPKVFESAIFSVEPPHVTDVIRTDTGFYIFQVTAREPARTLSFEEAEPLVRQRLTEDASRKQLSNLLIAARQSVQVTILPRRLPFAYSGNFPSSETE